ncbi:MAG: hypothetical protein ACXABY_03780 [Candidatus Thorarchaeota archaeon]|jgi:hypothetical protein
MIGICLDIFDHVFLLGICLDITKWGVTIKKVEIDHWDIGATEVAYYWLIFVYDYLHYDTEACEGSLSET